MEKKRSESSEWPKETVDLVLKVLKEAPEASLEKREEAYQEAYAIKDEKLRWRAITILNIAFHGD